MEDIYPKLINTYKYKSTCDDILKAIGLNKNNTIGYNNMLYKRVRKLIEDIAKIQFNGVIHEYNFTYPNHYPNESFTNSMYHLILSFSIIDENYIVYPYKFNIPIITGTRACMTVYKTPEEMFSNGERWNDKGGVINSMSGNEIIIRINERKITLIPMSCIRKNQYDELLQYAKIPEKDKTKSKKKSKNSKDENGDDIVVNKDDEDEEDENENTEVSKRRGEGIKTMKAFYTEMYTYDKFDKVHRMVIFMYEDKVYFFNTFPKQETIKLISGNIYSIYYMLKCHVFKLSNENINYDEIYDDPAAIILECDDVFQRIVDQSVYSNMLINLDATKKDFMKITELNYNKIKSKLITLEGSNVVDIDNSLVDFIYIQKSYNYYNKTYFNPLETLIQKMTIIAMLFTSFINDRMKISQDTAYVTDVDNYANKMYVAPYDKMYNDISTTLHAKVRRNNTSSKIERINDEICKSLVVNANKSSKMEDANNAKLVQILDRETHINSVSRMNTAVVNSSAHVGENARVVQLGSQIGFVCPFYTPESEKVGLRKEFALYRWISLYRNVDEIDELLKEFPSVTINSSSNYCETVAVENTNTNYTQEFLFEQNLTEVNNINTPGDYEYEMYKLHVYPDSKYIELKYNLDVNFVNKVFYDHIHKDLDSLIDNKKYSYMERTYVTLNYNEPKILFINGNPVKKISDDDFTLLIKKLKRNINTFDVVPLEYNNFYMLNLHGGLGGHFMFTTCTSSYIPYIFNCTTFQQCRDIFYDLVTDYDINLFLYKLSRFKNRETPVERVMNKDIYIKDDRYKLFKRPLTKKLKDEFFDKYGKQYCINKRYLLIDLWNIRNKYYNNKFKEYKVCGNCIKYYIDRCTCGNMYHSEGFSDYPIEFFNLITNGIIEFVSCSEVFHKNYSIAIDPTRYNNEDYAELDPTSFLSYSGSTVPYSNKTYGVRLAYQSNMVQQAYCTQPGALHAKTISHGYLLSGQQALCNTEIGYLLEKDCVAGSNIIVGVALDSKNSEDSFVCSESCTKTLLRYAKFKKETYKVKTKQNDAEKMGICPNSNTSKFKHIDPDTGLPILNSYVLPGEIIFAKYKETSINNKKIYEDTSFTADVDHFGVITKINLILGTFTAGTSVGAYEIDITFSNYRYYIAGDKICARYAQKQTLGEIVADNVLPVVASGPATGMRVEMLMSPAMYPSRQTSGLTNEFVVSLHGAYFGKYANATPFRDFDENDLLEIKQELQDVRYGEIKYELIKLVNNKKVDISHLDGIESYIAPPKNDFSNTMLSKEIYDEIVREANNINVLTDELCKEVRERIAANLPDRNNLIYSIYNEHVTTRVNIGGKLAKIKVIDDLDKQKAVELSENTYDNFMNYYEEYYNFKYNVSTNKEQNFELYVDGKFCNMFIGICRILLLRHQARDKIKALPKDPTAIVNNRFKQVKSGRDGGLRFNKQENNATMAGGAPSVSYERYSILGDGVKLIHCSNCGNRCSTYSYTTTCKCGGDAYSVNSAYGTIILENAASQVGIGVKFYAEPK